MAETVGARVQRLATARKLGGGTIRGIAAALGVSYETLRKWTRGLTAPHRETAERLGKLLRVSAEVVMYGGDLDQLGGHPDADDIADAFKSLPMDSDAAIDRRARLHAVILGLIELHRGAVANDPAPPPGEPPSALPRQSTKTRP
jgi:transcriptional regulator with XRE-family HTH domain